MIPGQFEVSEDCWIWKIGTETSYPLDSIDGRLNTYIRNPDNPDNNFSLALEYDSQGQKASAISYYLRAAERTNSVMFQYECLIKAAAAFDVLGMRALSVRGLLEKAIIIAPRRPEAYYLLSRWYERLRTVEGWMQSYLTACLGIEFSEKTAYKFRTNIDYPGFYGLLFEKAVSGWWMGQCEEACNIFIELHKSSQLDHSHRTAVISNLKQLGQFHTKNIRQYKSEYHSRLKFVFPGSDSIAQNFSESYQDMFVLSVLKGKRNGTFLEIGSANPFYGNNTALLEKNFGWTGIAIDLDKALAAEYNSARSTKCHNINALEIDYEKLLQEQNAPEVIDYLQIDIDPADVSLQCLKKIPFSTRKFNVITFEHDGYTQVDHKITNESRMILSSNGYTPLVRNVAPDDWRYYEDWWIRNELLDSIPSEMKDNSEGVKSAESYMLKP
jgi:tetratricopeptide (TPR) repeat protein